MRARILLGVAALLFGAGAASAFCVVNAIPDRAVQASLVPPAGPPAQKLFDEVIPPGRESCCNPRNAECNPQRLHDMATLRFNARVEAPAPRGRAPGPEADGLACGVGPNPRQAPVVSAPIRGFLRFEPNPAFDPVRRPVGHQNAPYVVRTLTVDRRLMETFACLPARP